MFGLSLFQEFLVVLIIIAAIIAIRLLLSIISELSAKKDLGEVDWGGLDEEEDHKPVETPKQEKNLSPKQELKQREGKLKEREDKIKKEQLEKLREKEDKLKSKLTQTPDKQTLNAPGETNQQKPDTGGETIMKPNTQEAGIDKPDMGETRIDKPDNIFGEDRQEKTGGVEKGVEAGNDWFIKVAEKQTKTKKGESG